MPGGGSIAKTGGWEEEAGCAPPAKGAKPHGTRERQKREIGKADGPGGGGAGRHTEWGKMAALYAKFRLKNV